MTVSGKSLIAGQWLGDISTGFTATNVVANKAMTTLFAEASDEHVALAIDSAAQAFHAYANCSVTQRANFLRTIAEQILTLGDELVTTVCAETGLPETRIQGERGRTVNQLNLFADLIESQEYQAVFDAADANRQPLPKPDTRLGYLPLGVVAVFGASNFPLAFSTAGGDTASALAAGCPVVMKAHTAHPASAELVAQAISAAIDICAMPAGVFSLIQGQKYDIAEQMVTHPSVKAVGFTGSERVGMILQAHINTRPEPIPFYGELGSVNPQFIMPEKLKTDAKNLVENLVASLLMGQGQFCTSPGVWFVVEQQPYLQQFLTSAQQQIEASQAGVMLTPEIADSYKTSVNLWASLPQVELLAQGQAGVEHFCQAALFYTNLATFSATPCLQQEVFGASAIIVSCDSVEAMISAVEQLKGNLTASIHAVEADLAESKALAQCLVHKVGRLIYNQMPTGVEVCASMNHGGPFPASTDVRTTSVGSQAITRFQRPICYQNMPDELLPALLKSSK